MKTKNRKKLGTASLLVVLGLILVFASSLSLAFPTGLEISGNVTETAGDVPPEARTDPGGTITTMILDVVQQNPRWKAYVGNLTGVLTLDDASGQSIFRWELGAEDISGNVFITRGNDVDWTGIDCSLETEIVDEDTSLGFTSSWADSINMTFSETTHPAISVGQVNIGADTCRSTSTFVNNDPQAQASADFPLILLSSGTDVVYATPLNQGSQSFSTGKLVDFQSIVPDVEGSSTTTYYFYAEISGGGGGA